MTSTRGMTLKRHLSLLAQGSICWGLFFVAGLPRYYLQHKPWVLGVGCTLLTVAIALLAIAVLQRSSPERRMQRAIWISFYFTVPLALYDTLYCAVYLGWGIFFPLIYWFLTIFYLVPWLLFPPIAWLLNRSRP
ncbi:MAG: hypothetical protein JNK60_23590 [Acidobacteria bacterium]|nr:hypothetical protein [Acidobacteriota bacterium]